jgi:excisionase family DNA binding protein
MPSPKTSLRIDELAEQWDVSRRTVEREIKRGELAAFKVGATWRVKAEEISRYEQNHRGVTKETVSRSDFRRTGKRADGRSVGDAYRQTA